MLARLATSQLVAFLEGQTGLVGQGGGSGGNSYFAGTVINGPINSMSDDTLEKLIGVVKAPKPEDEKNEQDENEQE